MIVLDASVIAKWFLEEENSKKAIYYLDSHLKNKERICVPSLLLYELSNVFISKKFNEKDIIKAFKSLQDCNLEVIHFYFDDIKRVTLLAKRTNITTYDATYLELALRFNCPFITADKKLFEKIKNFKIVKIL